MCAQGAWSALGLAVLFAALLNLALVSTFVWTDWLPWGVGVGLWTIVAALWVVSTLWGSPGDRFPGTSVEDDGETTPFTKAVDHYLKGNRFEAEHLLGKLLNEDPRDAEARLLLATLFRHIGRFDEAATQLQWLLRLESAGKWETEIQREFKLLDRARHDSPDRSEEAETEQAREPSQDDHDDVVHAA